MAKRKPYWFHPKTHTGWKKTQSTKVRRRKLWQSTPKNWSDYKRNLTCARRAQAIANVTRDPETKKKARSDANYYFKRARLSKK